MTLRLLLAIAAVLLAALLYRTWTRPPRLRRLDLGALGVGGPVIVQFTSPSCAPCRAALPHLRTASRESGVPLVQVDITERPEIARSHGIRTVPTIVVARRSGRVLGTWTRLPDGEAVLHTARTAR